jgi:HK97 family phage major capsid protein
METRELNAILEDLGETKERVESVAGRIDEASTEDQKALKGELGQLGERLQELETEKDLRLAEEERAGLKAEVQRLGGAIEELRKPGSPAFEFVGGVPAGADAKSGIYLADEQGLRENSFYADVRLAGRGHQKAFDRLRESAEASGRDVKAMVEGTDSAGGYLVPTEVSDELVRLKEYATPLRRLFSSIQVTSDKLEIAQQTGGLVAAWTDELATKTAADFTFGQISVSVFTAAGLAVVSNQLLQDARPSIDGLINQDLAKRIAILEEKALIDGSGTGQPRGILNTSGINAVTYTDATPTAGETLDVIIDAIAAVQDQGKTEPSDIALHPKLWTRLIKSRESDGHYTIEPNFQNRASQGALPSRTLFGIPVTLAYNIPTNKGAGTNETKIIVGDFKQGLILDRMGFTVDDSSHVYFTSNQTVFRGESRVGFTAARDPKAFAVVGGTGLIV